MKRSGVLLTLGFVLLLLAQPGRSRAADAGIRLFSGPYVQANFFEWLDPGQECVLLSLSVMVSSGTTKAPPAPPQTSEPYLWLDMTQLNYCSNQIELSAQGGKLLDATEFQISGRDLSSARLNTALQICDEVSRCNVVLDLNIDLTWQAIAPMGRSTGTWHGSSYSPKVNSHEERFFRMAQADGTLSDGTTNLTPGPSRSAEIGSIKSGSVSLSR